MARTHRPISRAERAGAFLAAANIPLTFQRTLIRRSDVDQGMVTGVTMALDYALALLIQDGIESIAMRLAGADPADELDSRPWRRWAAALDLAAMGTGFALQEGYKQHPEESIRHATIRTSGYWLSSAAFAGLIVAAGQELAHDIDDMGSTDHHLRRLPIGLIAAGAMAGGLELRRRMQTNEREIKAAANDGKEEEPQVSALKSLAIGLGTAVGLGGLTWTERHFARAVGTGVSKVLPGSARFWRPVGHATALWIAATGVRAAIEKVYHGIEEKAERIEPAFSTPPPSPMVSGSAESAVAWSTLSKQGRRHVSTYLRPEWIHTVMGVKPKAEPIRIYIGMDSAATEEARVQLAMDEIERTGAFDRELVLLTSPTGTGYANYVAVESIEYMTLGNCATVTMQYSKRPSFLSLDRTWEGEKHFKLLVDAIHAKLSERAAKDRPRIAAFGESLGAWTSQDAFAGTGTKGLQDAGIDRALWIGSPFGSKWHREVLDPHNTAVDHAMVGEFDSFKEVEALPTDARDALRYVMISHHNDAVVYFSPDLIVQAPTWLQEESTRPATVPKDERWVSPTTFLQTLVDMKNAANVIPGQFEAKGHDYRADLAQFVAFAFDLPVTETQLARIDDAMRRYELVRAEWIDKMDGKKHAEAPPSDDLGVIEETIEQSESDALAKDPNLQQSAPPARKRATTAKRTTTAKPKVKTATRSPAKPKAKTAKPTTKKTNTAKPRAKKPAGDKGADAADA